MLTLIISAGLAILISALCSITEAVLYSVPWSVIEQLRRDGKKSGLVLYRLRSDVDKPITAILTLNTIANTAGASVVGAAAVRVFGSESLGVFVAVFTFAILIFSEILPKTIGVAYCRTLAPVLARPLMGVVWAFSPLVWIIGVLSRRVQPSRKGPHATEDDIRAIVSLTRKSGIIQPYEERTIGNILSLDLKMVKDIMTPRIVVFSMPCAITVLEARDHRNLWHYSRFPVYDNDDSEEIVGLVYRRDVLNSLANDQDDLTLSSLMRPVRFVLESLTLDRLLVKLLESRDHFSVVLDEYGGMAGVVTLEDVLEEILGKEIVDSTDEVEDLRALARTRREQLTQQK